MMPDLANDPAVQAALRLNQARGERIRFIDRLFLSIPLPIGCYFLIRALSFAGDSSSDPLAGLGAGLVRGLECTGGFICFFLSLRAYFKIRRARNGAAS